MTREEAIKTLKENYCAICAYGSPDTDSCDISSCDNKEAIKVLEHLEKLEQEPKTGCEGCIYEKTGNNSTYPCNYCGRCYTDKYKAESEEKE